jgi:F0F1-type ATP synthase membrane subunit c/vacuolar-type H+-ATPase subunit K
MMLGSKGLPEQRRRFLTSGLSLFGIAFAMGSAALVSGCSDDKSAGQVENKGDIAKTPDAQDSMKASMEQMKNRGNPAGKKR